MTVEKATSRRRCTHSEYIEYSFGVHDHSSNDAIGIAARRDAIGTKRVCESGHDVSEKPKRSPVAFAHAD